MRPETMAQNQVIHLSHPTRQSQRPSLVARADIHLAAQNTEGPKGHTDGNGTETRQKSRLHSLSWIHYIPLLRSPFVGVLHSVAGKTAGRTELARIEEKREFPPLPGTRRYSGTPRSQLGSCPSLPAWRPPLLPKTSLRGGPGNREVFLTRRESSPSWRQKERMYKCAQGVRAREVRR